MTVTAYDPIGYGPTPEDAVLSKQSLRWTPVRSGATYCSPACGARCTLSEFQAATRAAEKLAASLGPRWKPRVWENLGWHYSAELDHRVGRAALTFEVHSGPNFWANLHIGDRQFHAHGKSARKAAERAICSLTNAMNTLLAATFQQHTVIAQNLTQKLIGAPKQRTTP